MKHTLTEGSDLRPSDIVTLAENFDRTGNLLVHKTSGLGKAIIREAKIIKDKTKEGEIHV